MTEYAGRREFLKGSACLGAMMCASTRPVQAADEQKVSGKIAFSAEVPQEMAKLLGWYGASEKTFENIPDFHVRFERIHPFQDGNGRIGRLVLLKECLKYGHTPFIIADDMKRFYYLGLQEWRMGRRERLWDTCRTGQDIFVAGLRHFGHVGIADKAECEVGARW